MVRKQNSACDAVNCTIRHAIVCTCALPNQIWIIVWISSEFCTLFVITTHHWFLYNLSMIPHTTLVFYLRWNIFPFPNINHVFRHSLPTRSAHYLLVSHFSFRIPDPHVLQRARSLDHLARSSSTLDACAMFGCSGNNKLPRASLLAGIAIAPSIVQNPRTPFCSARWSRCVSRFARGLL